ncbi:MULTISPECIES: hypothetical protein [Pseudomonas]|uniref:hypothetical protein n=1 Tax=Pseudomonas TaxID=286 RepID=UPI000EFDE044|nr:MULTISPECIES: hypothetical protein [Pseudomonas]WGT34985.1 hypothetical protein QG303_05335 [Pseudomonas atacamensis]
MKKDRVEAILEHWGPCLSNELADELVRRFRVSRPNARQLIVRSTAKRLKGISFPHRASFVYLPSQYGSMIFFDRLVYALKHTKHACGYGLAALKDRGGVLPIDHFKIACGAPKMQAKQVSAENVAEQLIAANLVKRVDLAGVGESLALASFDEEDEQIAFLDLNARLTVEAMALNAVRDWVKRLGIGSWNKVRVRDEGLLPTAGPNYWDLSAPSYLHPLLGVPGVASTPSSKSRPKPGSFVCDIYLGERLTEEAAKAFIKKCLNVRGFNKVSPVLQMFLAESYEKEAVHLIRAHGAIAATLDSLLGTDVAKALHELASVLKATARSLVDPEKIDALFDALGKIDGAEGNLRGCLFEYLCAELANDHYLSPDITINKLVRGSDGARAEIDVLVETRKEAIFIECKGHLPMGQVDDAEVEKWLKKRLPVLRDFAKNNEDIRKLKQTFELWTNAAISPASQTLIEAENAKTSRYTVVCRQGPELLDMVANSGNKPLLKTYRQHFSNHPLAVAARRKGKVSAEPSKS